MTAIYKILFEVQLLHEFYLTNQDNSTIFEGNAAARQAFLSDRFHKNERNISSDLGYAVPDSVQAVFQNYHLKLLPGYSGFRVAVEVNLQTLGGGIKAYEPVVPLPNDLDIPVLLIRKDTIIDTYTNGRLQNNLTAAGYFSNDNLPGVKAFPFLTNPVAAFNAAATYQQGELAQFAVNDIRAFYIDNGGVDQWLPVAAGNYTNEADYLLTAPSFYYTFKNTDAVTDALFTLKDSNNVIVQTIQASNAGDLLRKVALDFDIRKLVTLPGSPAGNTLLYTLEVSGTGGYTNKLPLLFLNDNNTDIKNVWALVNIKIAPANAAFNIIDNTGFLITRRNPDNTVAVPPPLFEIWVKSRLSFWRYTNNNGSLLKNGTEPDLLFFDTGKLISKNPRSHSYTPTLYKKADNSLHYLPNPNAYSGVRVENNRLFAEIPVSQSEMFPLGP